MSRTIAIAFDTTGLPHHASEGGGWAPRVVAIGVADDTPGGFGGGVYVKQTPYHLGYSKAKEALRFSGVTEVNIAAGLSEREAAKALVAVLRVAGVTVVASAPFQLHFLTQLVEESGEAVDDLDVNVEDVLKIAAERIGKRRISLDAAMAVFGIEEPKIEPDNRAHWRALCTLALYKHLRR